MNNNELGILLSAIIDKVDSERKINKVIKQIEVEAVKLNIQIDDKMAKSIAKDFTKQLDDVAKKQGKQWQGIFQEQIKSQTTTNDGLKKMSSYYKELEKQSDNFNKKNLNGIDAEIKAREQASKRFKELLKSQMQEQVRQEKEVLKSTKSKTSFDTRSNNLERQIRNYLTTNKRLEGTKQGTDLNNILKGFKAGGINEGNINKVNSSFSRIRKEANATGLEGQNMWDKLTGKYAEYGRFLLVAGSLALLRKSFGEAIQVVKELDQAMVNLQMVTGSSTTQTAELMRSYNQMAQELGATTVEIATAGNEFLRQGLSIADTNKLIEASTILSKVGMLSSAESTQYLTSAMKGYGVAVSDTLHIVDKLSAVDMESATSAGGLAEAMSKTATGAKLAGIEMDKLLGMLAATAEVTQADMASVGTAYRTIFARMSNIKLGKLEDEDGENISEYLSDAEQALDRVDIKLRKSATEFNNFGDIFDQLGTKWKQLSQVDQNAIATAFSGKMCARAA